MGPIEKDLKRCSQQFTDCHGSFDHRAAAFNCRDATWLVVCEAAIQLDSLQIEEAWSEAIEAAEALGL